MPSITAFLTKILEQMTTPPNSTSSVNQAGTFPVLASLGSLVQKALRAYQNSSASTTPGELTEKNVSTSPSTPILPDFKTLQQRGNPPQNSKASPLREMLEEIKGLPNSLEKKNKTEVLYAETLLATRKPDFQNPGPHSFYENWEAATQIAIYFAENKETRKGANIIKQLLFWSKKIETIITSKCREYFQAGNLEQIALLLPLLTPETEEHTIAAFCIRAIANHDFVLAMDLLALMEWDAESQESEKKYEVTVTFSLGTSFEERPEPPRSPEYPDRVETISTGLLLRGYPEAALDILAHTYIGNQSDDPVEPSIFPMESPISANQAPIVLKSSDGTPVSYNQTNFSEHSVTFLSSDIYLGIPESSMQSLIDGLSARNEMHHLLRIVPHLRGGGLVLLHQFLLEKRDYDVIIDFYNQLVVFQSDRIKRMPAEFSKELWDSLLFSEVNRFIRKTVKQAIKEEKFLKAFEIAEVISKIESEANTYIENQVTILLAMKKFQEAIRVVKESSNGFITDNTKVTEELCRISKSAAAAQDLETALEAAKSVPEKDSLEKTVAFNYIYAQAGEIDQILETAEQLKYSRSAFSFVEIVQQLADASSFEKAQKVAQKIDDPHWGSLASGYILFSQGKYEELLVFISESAEQTKKLLALNFPSLSVQEISESAEQIKKALASHFSSLCVEKSYEHTIRLLSMCDERSIVESISKIGRFLVKQNDYPKLVHLFQTVTENHKNSKEVENSLNWVALFLQNRLLKNETFEEAHKTILSLAEKSPLFASKDFFLRLASRELYRGNKESALKAVTSIRNSMPNDTDLVLLESHIYKVAEMFLMLGDVSAAKTAFSLISSQRSFLERFSFALSLFENPIKSKL